MKGKVLTIVLVLVVVASVVVGYLTFVGVPTVVPDFKGTNAGTNATATVKTYYATLSYTIQVNGALSVNPVAANGPAFAANVGILETPSTGQVYENQKLQMAAGDNGGGGGTGTGAYSPVLTSVKVVITITGAAGYHAIWDKTYTADSSTAGFPVGTLINGQTGRAFFTEIGPYSASLEIIGYGFNSVGIAGPITLFDSNPATVITFSVGG